jgi:serine protease Do
MRTESISKIILGSLILLAVFPVSAYAMGLFGGEKKTETQSVTHDRPDSFADLAEKLLPAVVNISTTQKAEMPGDAPMDTMPDMPQFPPGSPLEDFFNQFMERRGMQAPPTPMTSLGSGFVIDAEKGLIVTNGHVVKDADDVRVTFQDNETVKAEIVGKDEKTDLAVLKIVTKKKLTAVKFGNSDILRVGDWVLAIGNPFGLGGTVTAGIVSARQRDISAGPYDDFIQTDASINRGNSGGPMFNTAGELVGINTAIFSPSGGSVGIGFAIPTALAKPVIDQIVQYGRTKRGWLGVRIQTVTPEIAESLGLKSPDGALVASLSPKSPAEIAGLKQGDIITEFNGQRLSAMRQLPRIVAEAPIGSEAIVKFWRDGKEMSAKIKIGELEQAEKEGLVASGPRSESTAGVKIDVVGMTVENVTDVARKDYAIPAEVEGVLVTETTPTGEAATKGIGEGDVIVEINQKPVTSPQKAKEIFDKAKTDGKNSVLLLINREGDVRFVAVKLVDGQQ